MPGFGPTDIGKTGRGLTCIADPSTGRRKVGGLTIDWSTVPTIGINEVQTVTVTGSPTGGTFQLGFGGQTTSNLNHNADAATIEAALEALSTIGNGNARVSGTGPFTVEFVEGLRNSDVALMTLAANNLTGGSTPSVTIVETTKGRAEADLTLTDGTVVKAGDKFLEYGTVLVEITASGKYGPYDANASDGRQTVASKRGKVWIKGQTLVKSELGSDHTGDVYDEGIFFKARVKVGGTGQPTEANLLSALPGVTWTS
ncbi:MAG: head decoration protein [Fimbriimonadaceae bacterium]|nr:head decoration protein [Fimbriimonadaceae bacterium]QYK56660.1 MAG: head decoration protein [Fimbriimonadaceae bacterium]